MKNKEEKSSKRFKSNIMIYIIFGFILLISLPFILYFSNQNSYTKTQKSFREAFLKNEDNQLPSFTSIDLEGHRYNNEDGYAMPFIDTKVFHPFGDARVAIFQTGGLNQKNKVYLYQNGNFTDIADQLGLAGKDETSYSMAHVDIDNDGTKELLIGYQRGIVMHKYDGTAQKYGPEIKIADVPDAALPHDISYADTRNSGHLDLFVSTFVDLKNFTSATYHDTSNKRANLYLVNNGKGTFENKADEAGLGIVENTYLSKFVDLNNNGLPDLVLAMNTNVGLVYENLGDGKFKPHKLPMEYGFWMGLSVEKLTENDDKYHILMSNVGSSYPVFLLRGDLKKDEKFEKDFVLLEQINDFKFKKVTFEKNLFSNVFGWGSELIDLNNNGRKDAVLTENYINFPLNIHKNYPSKGKVFFQNSDGTFAMLQDEVGLVNPNFGYRVANYDFTNNGFQDIVIGNIDGPIKVFYNQGIAK